MTEKEAIGRAIDEIADIGIIDEATCKYLPVNVIQHLIDRCGCDFKDECLVVNTYRDFADSIFYLSDLYKSIKVDQSKISIPIKPVIPLVQVKKINRKLSLE